MLVPASDVGMKTGKLKSSADHHGSAGELGFLGPGADFELGHAIEERVAGGIEAAGMCCHQRRIANIVAVTFGDGVDVVKR